MIITWIKTRYIEAKAVQISSSIQVLLTGENEHSPTGRVDPVRGCLNNPIHLGWSTLMGLVAPLADLSPRKMKENYTKELI